MDIKKVLILGNGKSRLKFQDFINNWTDEIWVCNTAFTEIDKLPRLDLVGTVHEKNAMLASQFKKENDLNYRILYTQKINNIDDVKPFIKYNGWSTGNELISQALLEGYYKICLLGFDFGGPDIYMPNPVEGSNFRKQFNEILKRHGSNRIEIVGKNLIIPNEKKKPLPATIVQKVVENQSKVKENEIIIVGNSPELLKNSYGEIIDLFGSVVRINDYVTNNYEKHTGKKTTYWFTGASHKCKVKNRDIDGIREIFVAPGITRYKLGKNRLLEEIVKSLGIKKQHLNILDEQVTILMHDLTKLRYMSTGLMAIIYFVLVLKKKVTIVGFDFFQKYSNHYYDSSHKPTSAHNFKDEKRIVDNLIKDKKIEVLNVNSKHVQDTDILLNNEKGLSVNNTFNKIALFSLVTNNFVDPFEIFVKSLLKHNPWIDLDYLILDTGLTETSKKKIKSYYSNVKFVQPKDLSKYDKINMDVTDDILKQTYYKLELFNQVKYEKVIMLDIDMLVMGDLSGLIYDRRTGILGCRCFNSKRSTLSNQINTGVVIVTKEYLNEKTFDDLIEFVRNGYNLPDQKGINYFFKGKITYLAKKYNVEKRMLYNSNPKIAVPMHDMRIVHYVGCGKPWMKDIEKPEDERIYGQWEKYWLDFRNEIKNKKYRKAKIK